MGASTPKWNSSPTSPSQFPTTTLFHVSDQHGISGVLPNFEAGESWDTLHQAAHDRGEILKEHRHDS